MKHLVKLLLMTFLLFSSCSQQADDGWEVKELPNEHEMQQIGISLSRASLETFAEQGISEIGIYAYLKDSMVYGKNLSLGDGILKIELPLGESLQTFAVANADHLTDVDSLSKVVIYQDIHAQKQIYISDVLDFTSDKSISNLSLELKRLVGQAVFQPRETEDELNAINQFESLNITFSNVGVGYKVKARTTIQEDITVSADRATKFSAFVYSFPTVSCASKTSVDVVYIKGGEEVNRTNSPLDTGIAFQVSKRSVVYMPILEEAYLKNPLLQSRALKSDKITSKPFTIKVTEFK